MHRMKMRWTLELGTESMSSTNHWMAGGRLGNVHLVIELHMYMRNVCNSMYVVHKVHFFFLRRVFGCAVCMCVHVCEYETRKQCG